MTEESRSPLYVRLPATEAARLDRAAYELRTSKQALVTSLVSRHLHELADGIAVGALGDEPVRGHASLRPAEVPEVLTPAEAAAWLRVDEATVLELAEAGDLPGRRLAGRWRFSRAAVLEWLASAGRSR